MNAISVVKVTHHFNASPERVFDAWLDPKTAGQWLFATPTGKMVRVEIDARVGGRFVIVDRRDGEDVEHTGEYLEIDRPHRLVFTFGVPKYSPLFTKVIIGIEATASGCDLTLTQENVPAEYLGRNEKGWIGILVGLGEFIATFVEEHIEVVAENI
ncbi:MAG: SRPBCC domain-containing protein [Terracidiphilus sp.]|jgi:uncharacterized protein YndB with AHSA1/START domain